MMNITIEIELRQVEVWLSDGGLHRCLVFNEMPDAAALALLPQYGHAPGQAYALLHVRRAFRREASAEEALRLIEAARDAQSTHHDKLPLP